MAILSRPLPMTTALPMPLILPITLPMPLPLILAMPLPPALPLPLLVALQAVLVLGVSSWCGLAMRVRVALRWQRGMLLGVRVVRGTCCRGVHRLWRGRRSRRVGSLLGAGRHSSGAGLAMLRCGC